MFAYCVPSRPSGIYITAFIQRRGLSKVAGSRWPCATKLLIPGPHPVYARLVSPMIMRWQHFLSSSLDLVPRHGITLLFYTGCAMWGSRPPSPRCVPGVCRPGRRPPKSKTLWESKGHNDLYIPCRCNLIHVVLYILVLHLSPGADSDQMETS
jgi:hypothetical protein